MPLANSGTLSYNGVSFSSLYKSKITGKPVEDSAGRTVVGVRWSVDVEGYIAGNTTDATITNMRQALTTYGAALTYQNKGFGDLVVNAGAVKDVAYGPKPTLYSWIPVGNDRSCLVHWGCDVLIPECPNASYTLQIMEYCYEVSWDIDTDGFTKRTITGHVTVPATRLGRSIPDNADRLRPQITPQVPIGFQRTQSFRLSEDKRTLHFNFSDAQLPYPLPAGVSNASIRETIGWRRKPHLTWLTGSISGSLTAPANTPKSALWALFLMIVQSRIQFNGQIATNVPQGGFCFIDGVEVSNEIFGRSSDFSVQYHITGCQLSQLLSVSGMWKPFGATFAAWNSSMAVTAQNPRGSAGMFFSNSEDTIVDLCGGGTATLRASAGTGGAQGNPATGFTYDGSPVDPTASWIAYKNPLAVWETDRVARHTPLAQWRADPNRPGQVNLIAGGVGAPGPAMGGQAGGIQAGQANPVPDILQDVAGPAYYLRMRGAAIRIGNEIPIPAITSLGGQTPQQKWRRCCQDVIGTIGGFGGIPVYKADWDIFYALPKNFSGTLLMPGNPALGV